MVETIKLIFFSFIASTGFGIIFHIKKKYLFWAGLGGALTRACYLILLEASEERLIYSILSAMFAAFFAEVMAIKQKTPSTVFLYPAIIPLIPGDLIYNTAVNFLLQNTIVMKIYARDCALTLVGMSIGFVLISTFIHYRRVFSRKNLPIHFLPKKRP